MGPYPPYPPQYPPPPGQPPWYPPAPPPPRPNRRPLIIALSSILAVALVIGVVAAVVLIRAGNAARPADTVRAYLDALARGDAQAALALSDAQPASTTFLSDEVLKKQIERWPITGIEVTDQPGAQGFAMIKAKAEFGGKPSETEVVVRKRGGEWKLDSATLNVVVSKYSDKSPEHTLTLFGQPIGDVDNVYVFPGYLEFGSSNPYLGVQVPPLLLDGLRMGDLQTLTSPRFAINDAGRAAVDRAIETWLSACVKNPEANYRCVELTTDPPMNRATARIRGPVDVSGLTQTLRSGSFGVDVSGEVRYTIAADTADGRPTTYNTTGPIGTTVDLSRDPPAVGALR